MSGIRNSGEFYEKVKLVNGDINFTVFAIKMIYANFDATFVFEYLIVQ